jgi:8-oxo-dGTP pyrophosphatase MutT (NUDIX family)
VEALIESAWEEASRRPGVFLFDGPMCRLESFDVSPAALRLVLGRTSYKAFLGTNMRHPEIAGAYGRSALANPLGMSCALESADGFLLLGRRNATVAYYPSRVHPFAGALEPGDADDVFGGVRRELAEELSLTGDDVPPDALSCVGIAEDASLLQPELIFHARCKPSRRQVESQLDPEEHRAIVALPVDAHAATAALRHAADFTPVAVAAVLLWGRLAFGHAWFLAQCAALAVPTGGLSVHNPPQ